MGRALEERSEAVGSGSDNQRAPPAIIFIMGDIMDNIVNIISSVGFPIAMTLLLFWYMTRQLDKMAEIQKDHKEETNGLKDAITKLEMAITTLINKLDN